jgi:hypothetical protein
MKISRGLCLVRGPFGFLLVGEINNFSFLRSHCTFGARSRMGGVHSLPLGKE